jgi:hypothetical protein
MDDEHTFCCANYVQFIICLHVVSLALITEHHSFILIAIVALCNTSRKNNNIGRDIFQEFLNLTKSM